MMYVKSIFHFPRALRLFKRCFRGKTIQKPGEGRFACRTPVAGAHRQLGEEPLLLTLDFLGSVISLSQVLIGYSLTAAWNRFCNQNSIDV